MLCQSFQDRERVYAASQEILKKCGVFDIKGARAELIATVCKKWRPCPTLVLLYAKMGLHRYNFLEGTKFELRRVQKYVKSMGAAAASYYITFDAKDLAGGSSRQTFQTEVSEHSFGQFILTCNLAKIRDETIHGEEGAILVGTKVPEYPPENPFEKYYLVKDSELKDNDWIHLYLQLAIATTNRGRDAGGYDPPNLEIVNVAVDANDEGLNAKNAIFYIRYNDPYKVPFANGPDRIAIVKRSFDEKTGTFSLMGQSQSSDVILKKRKIANEEDQSSSETKRIKLNLTGLPIQISSSPLATCEDHEEANKQAVNSRDEEAAGVSME